MPRMRLRSMLILVAIIGVCLGVGIGLKRRSDRHSRLALRYGREASGLEMMVVKVPMSKDQLSSLFGFVHWNDAMANAHRKYSSKPWMLGEPDPSKIVCKCSGCESGKGTKPFGKGYGNETIPEIARNRQ